MDELGEYAGDPRVWPTTGRHFVVRPSGGPGYYVLEPRYEPQASGTLWYLHEEDGAGGGDPIVWGATAAQVLAEAIGDAGDGQRVRQEVEVYLLVHAERMGGWLTVLGMNEDEAAWAALLAAEGLMVYIEHGPPRYALTDEGVAVAEELRG